MSSGEVEKWSVGMNGTAREEQPPGGEGPAPQLLPSLGDDFGKNRVSVLFYFSSTKTARRLGSKHLNSVLCEWFSLSGRAVHLPGSSLSPFIHLMMAAGLLLMAVHVISVSLPSLRTSSRASMMGLPGGTDTWRNLR